MLSLTNNNINVAGRRHWYAVYTKHQHEKTVAQILTTKGFETLLPLYQTAHRWKDRTKLLSQPLFPNYVFIQGGIERRLDILGTPGIHRIVSYAGQPAEIPTSDIDHIRRAVETNSSMEPHPLLNSGDQVRVKAGPLVGITGILVRKKSSYRLILTVNMLGKAAAVEIDVFQVERLPTSSSSSVDCAPA